MNPGHDRSRESPSRVRGPAPEAPHPGPPPQGGREIRDQAVHSYLLLLLTVVLLPSTGCGRSADAVDVPVPTGYVLVPKGGVLVVMSQDDKKLDDALQAVTSLHCDRQPLKTVVANLSDKHGISVALDFSLRDQGIRADTPVSVELTGVTLRKVFEAVSASIGATYSLRDGVVHVTGPQSNDHLGYRLYYVRDLLGAEALAPDALLGWPTVEASAATGQISNEGDARARRFAPLVSLVQELVEPKVWQRAGGPCSIKAIPDRSCLAITAPESVHEKVIELFGMLRTVPKD
jgi:hypothetical protein